MTRLLLILSFVEEFDKIVFLEIKLLHIVRKVCVLGIIVRVYTLVGVYIGKICVLVIGVVIPILEPIKSYAPLTLKQHKRIVLIELTSVRLCSYGPSCARLIGKLAFLGLIIFSISCLCVRRFCDCRLIRIGYYRIVGKIGRCDIRNALSARRL